MGVKRDFKRSSRQLIMKTCAKHAGEKNVKHKEKKPLASHE